MCWRGTGKCFKCGQVGHKVFECKNPKVEQEQKKVLFKGRVYALVQEEVESEPPAEGGMFLLYD